MGRQTGAKNETASCQNVEGIKWRSTFCSGLHDQLDPFGSILHPLGKLLGHLISSTLLIKP